MPAFYRGTFGSILADDSETVLGHLIRGAGHANIGEHLHDQTRAWEREIEILKHLATDLTSVVDEAKTWGLFLEYPIPRRQKRLDVVLVAGGLICAFEFKIGARGYDAASRRQIEDYCLDLRDFHERSSGRTIVPILVATEAGDSPSVDDSAASENVRRTQLANASNLATCMSDLLRRYRNVTLLPPDAQQWDESGYRPVPTIIEAAEELFAGHSVREIARAHADVFNLGETSACLIAAVERAQRERLKIICFVTGVPGAGKTLAGLTVVHDPLLRSGDRPAGVFLSGNGPLVRIVSAALARDHQRRTKTPAAESRRRVSAFIQNVHTFLREYAGENTAAPPDKVVVFDEAQRAWDAEKQRKKFQRNVSESAMMLSIMDRHDWAVIVALVGGGQEIHEGEAGLSEWGRALSSGYAHWQVLASPEVLTVAAGPGQQFLFADGAMEGISVATNPSLHLPVSIRSFKAENVSKWVDAVIQAEANEAHELFATLGDFPIVLTRSLPSAREWLRKKTRGERRCGLVASSGALRLRAEGIELSGQFRRGYPYEEWFLAPPEDVRSSYQLEVAATEFECQGLELDWVGVCWGDDLVVDGSNGTWRHRHFHGKEWRNFRHAADRQFLLNKYRVLLTRAREGFVIWIPEGDEGDLTRDPALLDATASFLRRCGVQLLSG